MFVRSNGYLRPGWFGNVAPTGKTTFDPTTGTPRERAEAAGRLAVGGHDARSGTSWRSCQVCK